MMKVKGCKHKMFPKLAITNEILIKTRLTVQRSGKITDDKSNATCKQKQYLKM